MKVFCVGGLTKSGKTTSIEFIIKELRLRGYSVGSIKDIHNQQFKIDTLGTNTFRHKEAGSQLVTARGLYETDILFQQKLPLNEILPHYYNFDYVVVEGCKNEALPKILTVSNLDDLATLFDDRVFAISGVISNTDLSDYNGVKVFNANQNIVELVDLIEKAAFPSLPLMDIKCCNKCNKGCLKMCGDIVQGRAKREDCCLLSQRINLTIDGRVIDMVPFVASILFNSCIGVVKELKGYKSGQEITIKFRG